MLLTCKITSLSSLSHRKSWPWAKRSYLAKIGGWWVGNVVVEEEKEKKAREESYIAFGKLLHQEEAATMTLKGKEQA